MRSVLARAKQSGPKNPSLQCFDCACIKRFRACALSDANIDNLAGWWIDGDLALDAGGDLYASWDTQNTAPDGSPYDVGWLSYSTNHGRTWSAPIQGPSDRVNAPHCL